MKDTVKLLALLMHQFEIESFEVTCEDVEAFRREYGGELPVMTFQHFGDRIRVQMMSNKDAQRLRQ